MNRAGFEASRVRLKVLSPLHIGGGEDSHLDKKGYIYDQKARSVKIVDQKEWVNLLAGTRTYDLFMEHIKKNAGQHQKNTVNLHDFVRSHMRVSPNMLKRIFSEELDVSHLGGERINDIHLFVRDAWKRPYIPGSGLKGAIRTAVLANWLMDHPDERNRYYRKAADAARLYALPRSRRDGKRDLERLVREMEKEILGNHSKDNSQLPIGISISDSEAFEKGQTLLLKDMDYLVMKKDTNEISNFREYLKPGAEAEVLVRINPAKAGCYGIRTFEDLKRALDRTTAEILGSGGLFADKMQVEDFLPAGGARGVILGANTGFHQKTLALFLAPDRNALLELGRDLLHNPNARGSGAKIMGHQKDRGISPRVLNYVNCQGRRMVCGLADLERQA